VIIAGPFEKKRGRMNSPFRQKNLQQYIARIRRRNRLQNKGRLRRAGPWGLLGRSRKTGNGRGRGSRREGEKQGAWPVRGTRATKWEGVGSMRRISTGFRSRKKKKMWTLSGEKAGRLKPNERKRHGGMANDKKKNENTKKNKIERSKKHNGQLASY